MRRLFLWFLLSGFLVACGTTAEPVWAPAEEVERAAYTDAGPTSLTLFTVINAQNGAGAHSGLMVNGNQRVLFDPAGTWRHPAAPERNDVHYGFTPSFLDSYLDYHARITHYAVVQTLEVSPEVAQAAMQAVQSYGPVPKAQCSKSLSTILASLPGFEEFPFSWFPKKTMEEFAKFPGVTTQILRDDDAADNKYLLVEASAEDIEGI